ncbi:MAG TPA: PIN domain-containing protein [Kiritimatiellia bacterium]|nr:PIN domain-containing protein [Kiritimatiellia bacterium]HMO99596.1 PIN domain-containing protein [Kiritimatiellia bacterium]HMP96015.1 PIN domain-containing protein [Kiritimatiellia bacterium]
MINGLDTTFLVEMEVLGHPHHGWARNLFREARARGERFALTPQVIAEFIHVITDSRRFTKPLLISEAVERADRWWRAPEIVQMHSTEESLLLFTDWMKEFRLGRKRILDTLLAATYRSQHVASIYSTNARDFRVFQCFTVHSP